MDASASGARILVVDDEPSVRTAIARSLSLTGYHVEEAESGTVALEALRRAAFDLMLLDIRMPGLSGTAVMRLAREMLPELMIIVLTGHASVDSAIAAVKAEANDYLQKPSSLAEIGAAVSSALRVRAARHYRNRLFHTMEETFGALQHLETPQAPAAAHASPASHAASPSPAIPSVKDERLLQRGRLILDRHTRRAILSANGEEQRYDLTEGEGQVLEVFMLHPDEVLSCRRLAHLAWGQEMHEFEAQSLIRPYIFRLRQKFETNGGDSSMITTIRGRGYLFKSSR